MGGGRKRKYKRRGRGNTGERGTGAKEIGDGKDEKGEERWAGEKGRD